MSILAPLLLAALLLFLQGPLLQFSTAFTGGRAPGYWRALGTALLAGAMSWFAATAWGWTFGLLIGLFSSWLAWALTIAVGGFVASAIYRARLRVPFSQAVVITILHQLLTSALAAAAWYLYSLL